MVTKKVDIELPLAEFVQKIHGPDVSFSFIINTLLRSYKDALDESTSFDTLHKKAALNADTVIREST